MLEIKKSELIALIVSHYQQQLKESTYQMYALQQKYGCSFEALEQDLSNSSEEQFGMWEDYISWKGHQKSAQSLSSKIQKIEHGLFIVA
jgi:hypothetical protein